MRIFLFIFLITVVIACNDKIRRYKILIGEVDNAKVEYLKDGKVIELSSKETEGLKKVLLRNIKPELQRKFLSNFKIDIFNNGKRIGYFMISTGEKAFVNFNSDNLHFGFRLTYGIGMFLDQIR
jgi:hypothetical protein